MFSSNDLEISKIRLSFVGLSSNYELTFKRTMNNTLTGALSLLTAFLFISGYSGLFIINPQTVEELNNLGISGYNINGMKGAALIAVFYALAGLLNSAVAIILLRKTKKKTLIAGGIILLFISGIIWTSFGLISYVPSTEFGIELVMLRTILFLVTAFFGLLFIGADIEKTFNDRFLKIYTLATAGIILMLCSLSLFVLEDKTWIRTNISLALYFLWFGVFGIRILTVEGI